jgi:hypothetical protein
MDALGRAYSIFWIAVELSGFEQEAVLVHAHGAAKLAVDVVEPLRATLSPLMGKLAQQVTTARGDGQLLLRRSGEGLPGSALADLTGIAELCERRLRAAGCAGLAAFFEDARNTEVAIALLSVLLWAECDRLTDAPALPADPIVPRVLRDALVGLTRELTAVRAFDDSVRVEPAPPTARLPPFEPTRHRDTRDPGEQQRAQEDVQFTVYKPRVVPLERWTPLLAFAHPGRNPPDSPAGAPSPQQRVRRQAEQLLGADMRHFEPRVEDSAHPVPHEGELTFVPVFEHVEFSPTFQSFLWVGEIHRAEFRMRPSVQLAGTTAKGQMRVLCGPLILAELNLSLRVAQGDQEPMDDAMEASDTAGAYRKIFASYSHEDANVVRLLSHYARITGDEYLIDHINLRSGEQWSERLKGLIEEANIFQLFWSWNSMGSPFVRQEWEYALSLGRPNFVRPTYWETPFPTSPERQLPPSELRALHFTSVALPLQAPRAGTHVAAAPGARPNEASPVPGASGIVTVGAALLLAIRTGSLDEDVAAAERLTRAAARVSGRPSADPGQRSTKGSAVATMQDATTKYVPELEADSATSALFLVLGAWVVVARSARLVSRSAPRSP